MNAGPHSSFSSDLLGLLVKQAQLEARRQGNPLRDPHRSTFQSRTRWGEEKERMGEGERGGGRNQVTKRGGLTQHLNYL